MPLNIEENEVLQLVMSAQRLPILPEVATKVIEATTESETTVNEVATLIEKDMALSVKLLQVINSPFYGFSRGITSVNEAVSLMGFKPVANIALGLAAMSSLPRFDAPGFDYETFWEHSLARAVAAAMVTARVRPEASHSIFTIALLQNMGSYLLVQHLPVLYGYALALADEKSLPIARAERDAFGTDHAEIGARLAEHWNLPPNMVVPIRHHHYLDLDEELESEVKDLNLTFSVDLLNVSSLITDAIYGVDPDTAKTCFWIEQSSCWLWNETMRKRFWKCCRWRSVRFGSSSGRKTRLCRRP
jgi:HD-like signal output (HDOD) protein